jgi:F420-dependent oxidoreductase-like protein
MRLAISCGYAGMGLGNDTLDLVREAERLGYAQAWVAEAYGSDAPTVLAWLAGQTSTIGLGAGVMQIPARTPAMTAMTAATLDTLSAGRFHLGLGVSGPQVSEGWHGVRFAAPLARTREYVEIVRMALRRDQVRYAGEHFTLPLPDGPGKALRLTIRPPRGDLPIYLAAVGPRNLRLAGEVADGWLGIFVSPEHSVELFDQVRTGRTAAGAGEPGDPMAGFDVVASVPVVVTDDLEAARAALADYTALYIGGMGSREQNFYNALARRMGFEEAADAIQDLYLDGRPRDAADAVPFELVDSTALIGPPERIAERIGRYADAGVTTLSVAPHAATTQGRAEVLRVVADALATLA